MTLSDPFRDQVQNALGSDYTLERELGGGGMSRVFVARDERLGRDVVVKIVSPELTADVGAERFAREVKLAARLQHANIVPVHTAGGVGELAYYIMPYVRGETLRARIARGAVPPTETVAILRDIARALGYAHSEGIVHRDIKPENVLLSNDAAMVADFGIAKALSGTHITKGAGGEQGASTTNITRVGNAVGTPAYMAPEQAAGDPDTDARADVYAWGIMAYEMLAGAHPFSERVTPRQMLVAHMTETPPALATRALIPANLSALVSQCLEKEPSRRPATGRDLLTAMDGMSTLPTNAASPTTNNRGDPHDVKPSADTHRLGPRRIGVIGASLVAVVAVVIAFLTVRNGKSNHGATGSQDIAALSPRPTVVVIPFDNLGAADDAYFADGITDEIAGRLARIPGMRVIARASVLRFRGSSKSPQEIARELGAAYALSGTIRWARSTSRSGRGANDSTIVRIVPALIRTSTGAQIWGEPLQQPLTDVFKVQADVAERVAAALSLTLGASELAAVRRPDSRNADAQDAQLRGRDLLKRRGLGNMQNAVLEFRRAIALDSSYARAWAGYSEAVGYLPMYGDVMSVDVSTREAAIAARRAIALDSLLADAHVALALAFEHDQQFSSALASADRATMLDPGSATAWKEVGVMLQALGRPAEAERPLRRALELEPLLPVALIELAGWFGSAGLTDSLFAAYRKVLEMEPPNLTFVAYAELSFGLYDRQTEARAYCVRATGNKSGCRDLWRDLNDPERAAAGLRVLDTMAVVSRTATAMPVSWQAIMYTKFGATDSAFSRLSTAVRMKDPYLYSAINHPKLAPLHTHPGWPALIARYRGTAK